MADKKLNEVQKVTDLAYVPVIMSDGSIGQIAKADLATVVAGLINRVQCFSTSKTNSKSISIDVSGLFKQNEGTPKRWELLLGQWGQTAIAHAIGVCRYYVGDGTLNNAIVTASNSVTVSASIDTSGILTLSTSVSFSYVILNVYF